MKKSIIIVCALIIILIILYFLLNKGGDVDENKQQIEEVAEPIISIDEEKQDFCDSIGPQDGSASLNTNFVTSLRENTTLSKKYLFKGCVKNINGSYGDWESVDGVMGTYEVFDGLNEFITQGAIVVSTDNEAVEYAKTSSHIPFESLIQINPEQINTDRGSVVITNTNSSGNPARDKKIRIQVQFK